jgi:hypothetical protein
MELAPMKRLSVCGISVYSVFLLVLPLAMAGCGSQPAGGSANANAPQAPQAPQAPVAHVEPAMERVVAEVGVGEKGRRLDQDHVVDAIAAPAKALFNTKERVVFEIQIPQAMQLFKATEGRMPKSHQEFMDKIITFNNIPLPELPAGHIYVYDPAAEELMVERPEAAENRQAP